MNNEEKIQAMNYYVISHEIGKKLGLLTHGSGPMNVVPEMGRVRRNALAAFATDDEAIEYGHEIGGGVCIVSEDSVEVME